MEERGGGVEGVEEKEVKGGGVREEEGKRGGGEEGGGRGGTGERARMVGDDPDREGNGEELKAPRELFPPFLVSFSSFFFSCFKGGGVLSPEREMGIF